MKKYFFLVIALLVILTVTQLYSGNALQDDLYCNEPAAVTAPEYCGGFYAGVTWLYLKSMPTDGDLETGTFITLTVPPNLFARLQQLQSKPSNAFRAHVGYTIPATHYNVDLSYFHYKASDSLQIEDIRINQLIQSFLGGAYSTLTACEDQKINLASALVGKRFIVEPDLILHPYWGLTYGRIDRNLKVALTGLIDAPPSVTQSTLDGCLESNYWGVAPTVGAHFSFPLFNCIHLYGTFAGGALLGSINSCIDAVEINDENNTINITPFTATACNYRTVPFINSQLAFTVQPPLKTDCIDLELQVGYELDYYFNVVDRINPFEGFVINQNSFPVKKSSHLGLGGPFVKLSISRSDTSYSSYNCTNYGCTDSCSSLCDVYGEFTSSWLKPIPNNDDLVYALLNTEDGRQIKQRTCFNHTWNGTYTLGFQTVHDFDFHFTFSSFNDNSCAQVTAGNGASISSVNASGSDLVTYSAAQSRATYNLNRAEFLMGKYLFPYCKLQILVSAGLRYASLRRILRNQYTGGTPPLEFESKFNCLTSRYRGAGPVFALQPEYTLCNNLHLTAYLSTALLKGHLKSTLDQVNNGTLGQSTNTLRTPNFRWTVPVVDTHAGLSYQLCFSKIYVNIEAGYQFSTYFKAINQVFPNFLTGLEQNNSDLKLHGPYLKIRLGT